MKQDEISTFQAKVLRGIIRKSYVFDTKVFNELLNMNFFPLLISVLYNVKHRPV